VINLNYANSCVVAMCMGSGMGAAGSFEVALRAHRENAAVP